MPTVPTAQAGLLAVPAGGPPVPMLAVDLGADALAAPLRAAAIHRLLSGGLQPFAPPKPPGAALGWAARFGSGQLSLTAPGESVYEGTLTTWPALDQAIDAHGIVVTVVGHLPLGWGADTMAAADQAAARGDCAAGIVTAHRIDTSRS